MMMAKDLTQSVPAGLSHCLLLYARHFQQHLGQLLELLVQTHVLNVELLYHILQVADLLEEATGLRVHS